jgi:hypothetical protein
MTYIAAMTLTQDKTFQMRASEDFLEVLDKWRRRQSYIPSRAEAIRRLVELGLTVKTPPAGGKRRVK